MELWWTTEWDMMVGLDLHDEITATPPPVAVPMVPHAVACAMHWATNGDKYAEKTVIIEGRKNCNHMIDARFLIPHVPIPPYPPCVLVPVHIAVSQSKIILGAFTVKADGKVVGLFGLNLNCDQPVNLPNGAQIPTRMPTVWCGFSWMDILASVIVAAIDALISFAISRLVRRIPFVGQGANKALEAFWRATPAGVLLEKFALPAAAKIVGRGLLDGVVRKLGTTGTTSTGWVGAIDDFFSDTIASWNPHATPERIAAASDRSVNYFADKIHDDVFGAEGPITDLHDGMKEIVGEADAEKAINEVRSDMPKEAWRETFNKTYGQDFRDAMANHFEDECAKLNAQEAAPDAHA